MLIIWYQSTKNLLRFNSWILKFNGTNKLIYFSSFKLWVYVKLELIIRLKKCEKINTCKSLNILNKNVFLRRRSENIFLRLSIANTDFHFAKGNFVFVFKTFYMEGYYYINSVQRLFMATQFCFCFLNTHHDDH